MIAMLKALMRTGISTAVILSTSLAVPLAAKADGLNLTRLRSALKLTAIPRADNGRAIGMKVTLTKDSLSYKGVKGVFSLGKASRFNLAKMTPSYRSAYRNADGAYVYPVMNWREIESLNKNNIHMSGGLVPKFIYIYRAKYIPTGQTGIFLCTISNPDLTSFYETASGHGRCDVFKIL
jgi:hypothetical protein